MEAQQLVQQATEQFFEFMEKRFQPDISVRLSADSVEKHRDDISSVIAKIRRKAKEFKQVAETKLRATVPGLCRQDHSYLWYILDTVEQRMLNASDVMLPSLRKALHGFTKRADIIIRQFSYLNSQNNDSLVEICRDLAYMNSEQCEARLYQAAGHMSTMQVRLVDPQYIRLVERKTREQVDSLVKEPQAIDKEAQRALMIQQLLDQAFSLNQKNIKSYVQKRLQASNRISTRQMTVDSAHDLLALAHVIEVGAGNNLSSEWQFRVDYKNATVENTEYYQSYDEFSIELVQINNC